MIGKRVTLKVDYSVASIAREFGRVFVGDENVALAHVADGWAKVKDSSSQNDDDADALEALRLAEQSASANEMGIWSKDPTALARARRAPRRLRSTRAPSSRRTRASPSPRWSRRA